MPRTPRTTGITKSNAHPRMQYLTLWRMQIAARLADGCTKVAAVGREIGHESEAAFSRAFKKTVGISPAAWRDSALGYN